MKSEVHEHELKGCKKAQEQGNIGPWEAFFSSEGKIVPHGFLHRKRLVHRSKRNSRDKRWENDNI